MKRHLNAILSVCTVILFSVPASSSFGDVVINVDIQGNGGPVDAAVGEAAAHPDSAGASAVWNISGLNGSGLFDSSNVATSVGYAITSSSTDPNRPGTFREGDATPDNNVLYDYAFSNSNETLVLDITGLDPTLVYDLYVYGGNQFGANTGAGFDVILDGGVQSGTFNHGGGAGAAYSLNENYVVFTGLSATTVANVLVQDNGTGPGFDEPTISGFALVGTAAVPEPGSLALIGLIGMTALGIRRRS